MNIPSTKSLMTISDFCNPLMRIPNKLEKVMNGLSAVFAAVLLYKIVAALVKAFVNWRRERHDSQIQEIIDQGEIARLREVQDAVVVVLHSLPNFAKSEISNDWKQVTSTILSLYRKTGRWVELPKTVTRLTENKLEVAFTHKEAVMAMIKDAEESGDISPELVLSLKWVP